MCVASINASPGATDGEAEAGGCWVAVWAMVVAGSAEGLRTASPVGSGDTEVVWTGVENCSAEAERVGSGTLGAEVKAWGRAEDRAGGGVLSSLVTAAP